MKSLEEMTDEELFAELDAQNDTEFATSTLVKIVRSSQGPFGNPMTGDEFDAHLEEMARRYGGSLTSSIEEK